MNPTAAMAHLRTAEWTKARIKAGGARQCHVCGGDQPRAGSSRPLVGHFRSCSLARAIAALGGKVNWSAKNRGRRTPNPHLQSS